MNIVQRYADFESRIVNIKYMTEYRGFDLPPSQREKEWVHEQNSRFILSILENKPLGSFIFNKKNNKTYILDGQHRINALELYIKDRFGVKINDTYIFYDGKSRYSKKILDENGKIESLNDDEKRDFLDTEIFIREYNNLTDEQMADVIDSINEGIKNDNVNSTDKNTGKKIDNFLDEMSHIIYFEKFNRLRGDKPNNVIRFSGYIGSIMENYSTYETPGDYIQLNYRHSAAFIIRLNKDKNIDTTIENIIKIAKIIYSDKILNSTEFTNTVDKYDMNNFHINCIYYKFYEHYVKNTGQFLKESERYNNIAIKLLKKHEKNNFKELLSFFEIIYNSIE